MEKGDKVKIKSYEEIKRVSGDKIRFDGDGFWTDGSTEYFADTMKQFCGNNTIVTLHERMNDSWVVAGNGWVWHESWLEPYILPEELFDI